MKIIVGFIWLVVVCVGAMDVSMQQETRDPLDAYWMGVLIGTVAYFIVDFLGMWHKDLSEWKSEK